MLDREEYIEQGHLFHALAERMAAGIAAQGSYSYTAPDGKVYTVTWVADENGYQPSAAHLPVAPAV